MPIYNATINVTEDVGLDRCSVVRPEILNGRLADKAALLLGTADQNIGEPSYTFRSEQIQAATAEEAIEKAYEMFELSIRSKGYELVSKGDLHIAQEAA